MPACVRLVPRLAASVRLLAVPAALLLAACQLPVSREATLRAVGPAVYLNGAPAADGTELDPGDRVSTGAASSARVELGDGTFVQLDENSDPLFAWDGDVLLINIGYGWFLIDTVNYEVRISNELGQALIGSRVVVHAVPGQRLEFYLLEGRLTLVRPPGRPLAPNEKVAIGPGGTTSYGVIDAAERAALEARFARWRFPLRTPLVPNLGDDPGGAPGGGGGYSPPDDSPGNGYSPGDIQ